MERSQLDHGGTYGRDCFFRDWSGPEIHRQKGGLLIFNLKLASHPINWVTIFLMLVIAGTAGHLLLSLFGIEPADGSIDPNLAIGQSNIGLPMNANMGASLASN